MRIFKNTQLNGEFWCQSNPKNKIAGTLEIKDGGDLEVTTIGTFDEDISSMFSSQEPSEKPFVLLGIVEEEGFVTLLECRYLNKKISFGGVSKAIIKPTWMFSNLHYEVDEAIEFNTFRFAVEGLDEWTGISGLQLSYNKEFNKTTIAYSPPKEELIYKDEIFEIKFKYAYLYNPVFGFYGASIKQNTYLEISSKNPQSYLNYISLAHKIVMFLCLGTNKIVSIKIITATNSEILEEKRIGSRPLKIKVIYPSKPFQEVPDKIELYRMLFKYTDIRENIDEHINKWLKAYEVFAPALNLYFAFRTDAHRFLDGKFLSLAQCLETFHRRTTHEHLMPNEKFKTLVQTLLDSCPEENKEWLSGRLLHGNEISLRKRLKQIIEPFKSKFGNSKARDKFITKIVDTRNYLTHYNEGLKEKAELREGLWELCTKMEALFEMHLLKTIGFSIDQITAIAKNNDSFLYKLKSN